MNQEKPEYTIYLKDLLFASLQRWRLILIVVLLFGLLLGGVKLRSGLQELNSTSDDTAYQTALQRYESEKLLIEQQIIALENSLVHQQDYMENSLRMNLNPYCYYEATLTLFVEPEQAQLPELDKTLAILGGYEAALHMDALAQTLADAIGTQPQYAAELVQASICVDTSSLVVTVMHSEQSKAQQLLELVSSALEAARQPVADTVAPHQMTAIAQTSHLQVSTLLATAQKEELDRVASTTKALETAKTSKSKLVQPVLEVSSTAGMLKDAVLFAVIGGIVGAILAVALCCVCYIGSDRVYSARTLAGRTDVKVLGCLCQRQFRSRLDRRLHALEGRSTADPQAQAALLAVNIRNRSQGLQSLLLTGAAPIAARQALVQALKAAMPGVQLQDLGSLQQDAAALEQLALCDGVLLIEQCRVSQYAQVAQSLQTAADHQKPVIGCVLLDG